MHDTYAGSVVSVPKQSHLANFFCTFLFAGSQALSSTDSSRWNVALDKEMSAHSANHTWDLVDIPSGRRAIGCRCVFNIKDSASPPIYKARPVAQGCSQVQGLDYQTAIGPSPLQDQKVLIGMRRLEPQWANPKESQRRFKLSGWLAGWSVDPGGESSRGGETNNLRQRCLQKLLGLDPKWLDILMSSGSSLIQSPLAAHYDLQNFAEST
ncbi:catalytic activity protein [[Candida] boidinii]|nr:catalytic activity protein [[Candida] boidinii]